MIRTAESWENESRFFVPNEDAEVARQAFAVLAASPCRPAFVCGSGMLLLDVLEGCPNARGMAVDISSFQVSFFRELQNALRATRNPAELRGWFSDEVYPQLREHYARRGQEYPLSSVFEALRGRLGIRFFSDEAAFQAARLRAGSVDSIHADMADWLCRETSEYDFVHLSNIVDYLPVHAYPSLFMACRARRAPVLYIRTTACSTPEALRQAWNLAGYVEHPVSEDLSRTNRALGAQGRHADKPWIRTGEVVLLV